MNETWKQLTERLIVDFCNKAGSRTFSLEEFQLAKSNEISSFSDNAKTPFATLRRVLQELRNEGIITFVDNRGTYTLRKPAILQGELEDNAPIGGIVGLAEDTSAFDYGIKINSGDNIKLEKREYTHETFARNRGWVKQAKDTFGSFCLHPECQNTFLKPDGNPYIEVHHIIPLFKNGEDAIWNLTVLCAHHHRMAHFAEEMVKDKLQTLFLGIVNERLQEKSI